MVKLNHLSVLCESCDKNVSPETPAYRLHFILGFVAVLGGIGFLLGLTFGIATAGTGWVAWPLFLVIGAYGGYKVGDLVAEFIDGYSCPDCGKYFTAPTITTRLTALVR